MDRLIWPLLCRLFIIIDNLAAAAAANADVDLLVLRRVRSTHTIHTTAAAAVRSFVSS